MSIHAIPTMHNGVRFRSRLEASWAETLNQWGIDWSYEPESYRIDDGPCYLPDFWLPETRTWLEVKGPHGVGMDKVRAFADEIEGQHRQVSPGAITETLVVVAHPPRANCAAFEGAHPHSRVQAVGRHSNCGRVQFIDLSVPLPKCRYCDDLLRGVGVLTDVQMSADSEHPRYDTAEFHAVKWQSGVA